MYSIEERYLSNNWTGSYMENPLDGDFEYIWKDNEVIISGSGTQAEGTWERKAFSASAAYICQNGGDILQIGYGFDQMSCYIQSHSINSHTIIIDQQQGYEHATEWIQDKTNVTIITGSFYEKDLSSYDGVFINKTRLWFCNKNTAKSKIAGEIPKFTKTGSFVTWYNQYNWEGNLLGIDGIEYQLVELDEPSPENNIIFVGNKYYMPKLEIK